MYRTTDYPDVRTVISKAVRKKASYQRCVNHELIGHRRVVLKFKAYKLFCNDCGRYGNQQFPGINKHQRSTERLKGQIQINLFCVSKRHTLYWSIIFLGIFNQKSLTILINGNMLYNMNGLTLTSAEIITLKQAPRACKDKRAADRINRVSH